MRWMMLILLRWLVRILTLKSHRHLRSLSSSINSIMDISTICFLFTPLGTMIILARNCFVFLQTNRFHHIVGMNMVVWVQVWGRLNWLGRDLRVRLVIIIVIWILWRVIWMWWRSRIYDRDLVRWRSLSSIIHVFHFLQIELECSILFKWFKH